jgi:hypothetical protein
MQTINSPQGRWSVTVCSCSQETIHVIYGNATLHILVEDLRELGIAMQKMAEGLEPQSFQNGSDSNKKELLQ